GAITQVDKKFTKKEGKPFGVVFIEDLTGTLEVVVWNEVYAKLSDTLVPGRVIAILGTLDKRDDTVRATAQKVKLLAPDPELVKPEPSSTGGREADPMVLRFSSGASASDLHEVREILALSPGATGVRLLFEREGGELLRLDAGAELRVSVTPQLTERLARWRVA
ncbi:MAG: OB-fold nucleic acid binding domain-containing protein, partial [Chthoniobacterales bacterium]